VQIFRITLLMLILILCLPLMAQQIRICALRVDFVADDSDLTTGDGLFMVDSLTTDRFAIDPAPHNRLYFQDQILAAANYFNAVSQGRVQLSGDVYPLESDSAYHLVHEIGYYNPNTTNDEIDAGLARLFVDAIEIAKEGSDNIDFDAYDLVVVFHAGVGRDVDVGYDSTPQDIPSLFITHGFLKQTFGQDFLGVDVGSAEPINSGIILPETENQDGYALALTGIFVSNIASHLGLYDLFSASDQRSGVGRFGLMDVGLMNMNGLIPSPPGAFSRSELGWDVKERIEQPADQIVLKRLGSDAEIIAPTLIEIPINEDEYYLLEFRGDSEVDLDSLYAVLAQGREELPTYLELLETYYGNVIERGESGVLISVPDYDWGIPGAGILIWHIDEKIKRDRLDSGSINDDPLMRAVDIEEADGSQDIGQIYTLLDAGYQKELGWFADFWFSNRPGYLNDFELYTNTFSASSTPNTNTNRSQAQSHITLTNFSNNHLETMSFDYKRDWLEPGFPRTLADSVGNTFTTISGPIEYWNDPYLFTLTDDHVLSSINSAGQSLFPSLNEGNGETGKQGLALADTDNNIPNDMIFVLSGQQLSGIDLISKTERFSGLSFGSDLISGPVVFGDKVAVGCANDTIYVVDKDGNVSKRTYRPYPGEAILFDPSGQLIELPAVADYAVLAPVFSGQYSLLTYATSTNSAALYSYPGLDFQLRWDTVLEPTGPFAVADVDDNGVYDFLFNQADGIYALNREGHLLNGFPLRQTLSTDEAFVGSPLILDADNDGHLDYLAATNQGNIFCFRADGRQLNGFPISTGGGLKASPIVLQFDEDPEMELLAVNNKGSVYAWQLQVTEGNFDLLWLEQFNSPENNTLVQEVLNQKTIGQTLMPAERVYNYPNPNSGSTTKIRYYLNESAQVRIRIFDPTGAPVDAFDGPGRGGVDNEIEWDVSAVASGVYLCKVQAKSDTETVNRIIKIMVVH